MNYIRTTILFLFLSNGSFAQSVFDKIEAKLINNLTISAGAQFTWYKESNIYFEQRDYNRQLNIFGVHAVGRGRFNEFFKGRIGCSQFRVDIQYQLSRKYILQAETTHLDYLVDLEENYYQRGEWDGERINGEHNLLDRFTLLEHSNGINIWKLGLIRKITFKKMNKLSLSTGIQVGFVMSATQANIYTPYGDVERFDAGNTLVGISYSSHSELIYHLSRRLDIFFNFTYFQMDLNKAHINSEAFVTQTIVGSNSGINIRYRL